MLKYLVGFSTLFITLGVGCSSNTNPLALYGNRCLKSADIINPSLSETEKLSGKLSQKIGFSSLPEGEYTFKRADIFIHETVNGEDPEHKGFKAHLVGSVISSPKKAELESKKNQKVIDENGQLELHSLSVNCLRNTKQNRVFDFNVDGITQFTVKNGEPTTFKSRTFGLYEDMGPQGAFKASVSLPTEQAPTIEEFYQGLNSQYRPLRKMIYQLTMDEAKPTPELGEFEVRSEFKSADLTIRFSTTFVRKGLE